MLKSARLVQRLIHSTASPEGCGFRWKQRSVGYSSSAPDAQVASDDPLLTLRDFATLVEHAVCSMLV
jgi:hypothetical protein